jgi:YVTN family beta-propeller protein
VYVVNGGDNSVSVIDASSDTVVATLAVGDLPKGIAVSPAANRVYVANSRSANVTVIDGASNEVLSTIPAGQEPTGVGVNGGNERLYVANLQSFTVSVIDGATGNERATLPVGDAPQAVAVNEDTGLAYIANGESATVSVIDGVDDEVVDTIPVGGGPLSLAIDPRAGRLYVVNAADSTIGVVETASSKVVSTTPADGMPWAVAVNPDTNRIYLAQRLSNTVLVIDGGRLQQATSPATIGVDAEVDDNDDGTADNTATSLGAINSCISVDSGATFDVDIFVTDLARLRVWSAAFHYDPSVVSVVERDVQMLLAAKPGSQVKDQSLGDAGVSGSYDLLASDVSDEPAAEESGSGVLVRLTLRAVAGGVSNLTVGEPFLFPFQSVESTASAFVAVDEACPH